MSSKTLHVDVILPFPIGNLGFRLEGDELCSIHFHPETSAQNPSLKKTLQPVLAELQAYFKNPQYRFKLNLHPQGTAFQKAVWQALQTIPCGQTRTYQDLARILKTSPRAVGNACRRNPFPIFIPCHRVVAKNSMGGFCGARNGKWLEIKQSLLAKEAAAASSLKQK